MKADVKSYGYSELMLEMTKFIEKYEYGVLAIDDHYDEWNLIDYSKSPLLYIYADIDGVGNETGAPTYNIVRLKTSPNRLHYIDTDGMLIRTKIRHDSMTGLILIFIQSGSTEQNVFIYDPSHYSCYKLVTEFSANDYGSTVSLPLFTELTNEFPGISLVRYYA